MDDEIEKAHVENLDEIIDGTGIEAGSSDETVEHGCTKDVEGAKNICEEPLTFDEKVEAASKIISQNPNFRRVFYGLLDACADEARPLDELEALIDAYPGYEKLRQPAYFPISWLEGSYALEELYLDKDGKLHTYDDIKELSEDEFDDLVEQYAYLTTDVGRSVRATFDPKNQLETLIEEIPERTNLYLEILDFTQTKHTYAEIDRHIRGREELTTTSRDGVTVNPNAFISKLADVGGIVYDDGWQISDEGRAFLSSFSS